MSNYMEEARRMRPFIEKAAQSLSDSESLEAKTLYPRWEDLVVLGTVETPEGFKFRYENELYKCRNANPVFRKEWVPGINTSALYVRVANDTEAGTRDNPITADRGMEYIYGKYYKDPEDGKTYLCQREGTAVGDTIVLAYLPHELVGLYFTEAI
jgi:hypothetical protein